MGNVVVGIYASGSCDSQEFGSPGRLARAEAFNTFNHTNFVNFNGVATILGQTNFGQVTGADSARILQLALKVHF